MGLRIYSGENNRVLRTNGQPLCTRMRALASAAAQRPERYLFVQGAILQSPASEYVDFRDARIRIDASGVQRRRRN